MTSKKQTKFMASTLTAALVATAIAPTTGLAVEKAEKPFSDVELGTPYTEPITQLKEAEVMSGYPDGTFGIRTQLTRAHAAIMFTSIRDLDTNVDPAPFNDVKQDVYYTDAINAAYAAGVIQGHTEKEFAPNDNLTRGQMAVMMVQAYGLEQVTDVELPFTDLKENHWATPYIKTLYANGLFNGKSSVDGAVAAVNENVDRGDFAILLAATDVKFGHKLGNEDSTELVVKSVETLNTTVDMNGTLEFAINGKEEAADLEALKAAGYEVEFKASANVFEGDNHTSTTGKVASEKDVKFQYQVVIKKDNKVVAESVRQEVEVLDYANTITAITEVTVHKADLAINDGQLAMDDQDVKLTIKGTVMGNKDTVTFENATYSVDRPAILSVDSDGTVTTKAKGDVVVTVKVGEKTETIQLNVGETRKVDVAKSTISENTLEIAADKTAKVIVELKDQYGLAFNGEVTAENAEDTAVIQNQVTATPVKVEGKEVAGQYQLELTAVKEAAEGNIVVKANNVELGTINVTVKEAGGAETYELTAENTEFDLKTDAGKAAKTVKLKAYDKDGLEAEVAGKFIYESSDENVIKVNKDSGEVTLVTTESGKTAKVIAKKVTGGFIDEVAKIEFTVIDSTPFIKEVEFTSMVAIQNSFDVDFKKLGSVVATGSKGDVEIAYQLAADKKSLEIVEADDKGVALNPAVVIGTVTLTPEATIEEMNEDGTFKFAKEVNGKEFTLSYIDHTNRYIGQREITFDVDVQQD